MCQGTGFFSINNEIFNSHRPYRGIKALCGLKVRLLSTDSFDGARKAGKDKLIREKCLPSVVPFKGLEVPLHRVVCIHAFSPLWKSCFSKLRRWRLSKSTLAD